MDHKGSSLLIHSFLAAESMCFIYRLTLILPLPVFPAPPQLIEKPQDAQKLIDDSLVWECKATGKPKPSYRWMKNGENLDSAEVRPDRVIGCLYFILIATATAAE